MEEDKKISELTPRDIPTGNEEIPFAENGENGKIKTSSLIKKKVSELENDKGYITKDVSDLTNYTKTSDLAPVDLSYMDIYGAVTTKQNTANCYIVNKTGAYMLPLVYGNAIKNGNTNSAAYTKNTWSESADFVDYKGQNITSPYISISEGCIPSLIWQDSQGMISELKVKTVDSRHYLQFKVNVPGVNGNAVVAVMDKDRAVMWSWHIWACMDDLDTISVGTYEVLPFLLGWKYDSSGIATKGKAVYYQWGRKDPFPTSKGWNSDADAEVFGERIFEKVNGHVQTNYAIAHPETFFYTNNARWHISDKINNFWNANNTTTGASADQATAVKTVYDPSPVGFIVSDGQFFVSTLRPTASAWQTNGYRYSSGLFLPAIGYRSGESGNVTTASTTGYLWTYATHQTNAYYCQYINGGQICSSGYKTGGCPLLVVKEQ